MLKKKLISPTVIVNTLGNKLRISVCILTIGFSLVPMLVRSQQPMFQTGVISAFSGTGFVTSAYPVIDRLKNGRLVCVFSSIADEKPSKMNIAFSISDDNGLNWSKPQFLFNHSGVEDADPSLLVDGDRILAFSTTVSVPGIDSTDIYMRSSKDGLTWGNEVHTKKPYRYISGKIHQGHRLKDGTLIMGYAWDAWAEKGMPPRTEGEMDNRSGVLRSTDGGASWSAGSDIIYPEEIKRLSPGSAGGLCEPATVVLSDGRIMALVRTVGNELYKTYSSDNGLSWEYPRPSGLTAHNTPAALWKLDNSSDVLVAWNNSPVARDPLTVALTTDGGKTWSPPRIVVKTGGPQASYPSVIQAKDGTMIVVWQQNVIKGREVRIARFNRAWLLTRPANNNR